MVKDMNRIHAQMKEVDWLPKQEVAFDRTLYKKTL